MAKKAYVCFCTASIHKGHLNILAEAAKLGEVTVGILSDREAIRYNRFPVATMEERIAAVKAIPIVKNVIVQEDMMYSDVIAKVYPDYVVHGDNWSRTGDPLHSIRSYVENLLSAYGGKVVDVPYTDDPEVRKIDEIDREKLGMPEYRRRRLRQLLGLRPIVKAIEAHSGLTGLIAEKTIVARADGSLDQFDAMWVSSLCDSTEKGKPDIELVDMSSRLRTIDDIMEVTTKPIILDGDTGGLTEHFVYNVQTLERIGVSAVIIEDKTGLKQNSLFGTTVKQTQDSTENFSAKIAAGKEALRTKDFMIIARCESLIAGQGEDDAIARCRAYCEAGADGIMIHSKAKTPDEVLSFVRRFRSEVSADKPIVVVPSTYAQITEDELTKAGINVVIYANHLLRAAYPAMRRTAERILECGRAYEASAEFCMPIKEVISLI